MTPRPTAPLRVRIKDLRRDEGLAFVSRDDGSEVRVRWRTSRPIRWRCDVCGTTYDKGCSHARAVIAVLHSRRIERE